MLHQTGHYKEDFVTNNDEKKFTFVESGIIVCKL